MSNHPFLIVGTKTLSFMIQDLCANLRIPIHGFIDDASTLKTIGNKPVVGTIKHVLDSRRDYKKYNIAVAIGDNGNRKHITEMFLSAGFQVPMLIDPSCVITKTATIERAVVLFPFVYVGTNVTVKKGTILLPHVTLTHDDIVGEYSFIAPHVTIEGRVNIKSMTKLKSGTVVPSDTTI